MAPPTTPRDTETRPVQKSQQQQYQHAEIILNAGYSQVRLQCQYLLPVRQQKDFFGTVDLILAANPHTFPTGLSIPSHTHQDAFVCELDVHGKTVRTARMDASRPVLWLIRMAAAAQGVETGVKLILPAREGYMCRSDLIEERLRGCGLVQSAAGFVASTEERLVPCQEATLSAILSSACGGLVTADSPSTTSSVQSILDQLEPELDRRLSFPWLSAAPFPRRRLAVVQARKEYRTIERFYMAARALNISLIAVDSPGHWLQDDTGPSASLREAFIPLDMTVDERFPHRLYAALKDYRLDGIITSNDRHLVGVAQAAEMLGLPTMPSAALAITTDKAATRAAEEAAEAEDAAAAGRTHGPASFSVDSLAELDDLLARPATALPFPLIVKPCLGWSSDCVARVTTTAELRDAVHRAASRHTHSGSLSSSTKVVVEPYIAGPEVDTNILLLDGECLFFEVADDFPSTGDAAAGAGTAGNFQETQIVYPSALPEPEQRLLRSSIHRSLLRLGLHTGVFHVEARVRDSAASYQSTPTEPLDLLPLPLPTPTASQPSCWLLEINARPPGGFSDWASAYASGVCYHAQAILAAIDDKLRFRVLATPFAAPGPGDVRGGADANPNPNPNPDAAGEKSCPVPQFDCMLAYVSPDRAGVLRNDPCAELARRAPELQRHVLRDCCWYRAGDAVSGPQDPSLGWLATYLVFGTGRGEVLRLGERIRGEFRAEIA
ncbi:uncharacterized protein ACLA_003420 [Aspergillus clavatus NRRL 1]|uniref:ATP-grasp domain-containing protein n=1 Tax=Aspergillus clavatus (strain ATCC 1007 / CBS 513.65 / DSM 816 / NCTC 3887 / NRRL 1 / QM 1276 / 107) TaxID=344612 RepID=A1C5G1_ASPCL|nr:uncharacterized protein ACLA_003420 [Aspergillus clavatus NRRL 1]EAW14929.1 conserved hypothetical protein [Aspergillus clavatus NRRL 1]